MRVDRLLDERPLENWARLRWFELAVSLRWLHARTGEGWLQRLWEKTQAQGYDWPAHFADFQYTEKQPEWLLENHVVNQAMALKEPALRLPPSVDGAETALRWMETLDEYHGQAAGVFSGDESLAGLNPSQGTETCAVVEYLYSLELLIAAFGEPAFCDRLERIAYNALPAPFTKDMGARQYVQQANQAVTRLAPDGERIYTNNGPTPTCSAWRPTSAAARRTCTRAGPSWSATCGWRRRAAVSPPSPTGRAKSGRRLPVKKSRSSKRRITRSRATSDSRSGRRSLSCSPSASESLPGRQARRLL